MIVHVGQGGKRYYWHTELIRKESPLIASRLNIQDITSNKAISEPMSKDAEGVKQLFFLSHDPNHFDIITEWLYKRDLEATSPPISAPLVRSVYMTACSLNMEALQNDLMDLYQTRIRPEKHSIGRILDRLGEVNTEYPESGMRRFLLDHAAVKIRLSPETFTALRDENSHRLDTLFSDKDLARDLMLRVWDDGTPTRDVQQMTFHSHKNGSKCKAGCEELVDGA